MGNLKQQLLDELHSSAFEPAQRKMNEAEETFKAASEAFSALKLTANQIGGSSSDIDTIKRQYNDAEQKLQVAQSKFVSKNYQALLEIPAIAQDVISTGRYIIRESQSKQQDYKRRHQEKVKEEHFANLRGVGLGILLAIGGAIVGAIAGGIITFIQAILTFEQHQGYGAVTFMSILCSIIGFFIGFSVGKSD